MLNPTIFREYDIRGVAETDLHSEGITDLGQAVGTYVQNQTGRKQVNLARDCRLSSPRLRDAFCAGLKQSGCEVTDIGIVPTPLLYYSVLRLKAAAGIMITGSHNPREYNGFKIMVGESTIHGEDIQTLRHILETRALLTGGGSEREHDIVTPYVDEITSKFDFSRRVKLVFDGGNGVGGPVFARMVERLNVQARGLFLEMDGSFPNHDPDPTQPKNLSHLIQAVRAEPVDLGIAFDGDSDRIGAVDETGEVIYGDMLLLLYGREILTRKPGATVIGEVKCSQILYDQLRQAGGKPVMWKTGHSLIKAKMKETHAELAGEMSGHMFFADGYYGFDDALYAACRLIEIVSKSGEPLSAQLAGIPKMVSTPELRLDCPDETKFAVVAAVRRHFQALYEVNDVDGARIKFAQGWGLLRASNTQPVLVMRFEAETEELLRKYQEEVEAAVRQTEAASTV